MNADIGFGLFVMTICVVFLVRSLAPVASIARRPGVYSNVTGTPVIDRAPPSTFATIVTSFFLFAAVILGIASWTFGLPIGVVAIGLMGLVTIASVAFIVNRFRQLDFGVLARGGFSGTMAIATTVAACFVALAWIAGMITQTYAAFVTTMFAISAIYTCAGEFERHHGTTFSPLGRRHSWFHFAVVAFAVVTLIAISTSTSLGITVLALNSAIVFAVAISLVWKYYRTFATSTTTTSSTNTLGAYQPVRQFATMADSPEFQRHRAMTTTRQVSGTNSNELHFRWTLGAFTHLLHSQVFSTA